MWTLQDLRTKLADRLAETSNAFWTVEDRDSYLNEAQRQIAAITGGVTKSLGREVNNILQPLTLPKNTIGTHITGADTPDGGIFPVYLKQDIEKRFPQWRKARGTPKWVVLDLGVPRATLVPAPAPGMSPVFLGLTVAIIPDDMTQPNQPLFAGQAGMEKFQGALLNLAASLALLKERYDGDAERFYQFFEREMRNVGIELGRIPQFSEVREAE